MISNCFVYLLCLELGCLGSHPVADHAACLTERPSRPRPSYVVAPNLYVVSLPCPVQRLLVGGIAKCAIF